MIGNDIVDLQLARRASNWRRPRYLDKLFTAYEQQQIATAADPDRTVWWLWSCKEAAYKSWAAEHQQRVLAPRRIEVNPEADDHDQNSVAIGHQTYAVQSILTERYVHSWTLTEDEGAHAAVLEIGEEASMNLRQALCGYLHQRYGWSCTAIELRRDRIGKPWVYVNGRRTGLDISLSHHGGYGGFVVVDNPCAVN